MDSDEFDESTGSTTGIRSNSVPDDLELSCGCHYHWQCLLDLSSQVAVTLQCPSCGTRLVSVPPGPSATNPLLANRQEPKILTRYINEGGVQESLDVLPLITEEAYLDANPAARPARAYLTMCTEGDVSGIIEILQSIQSEVEGEESKKYASEILRYQDPLDGMKSALHLAVEYQQLEVMWLLMWLASSLRSDEFPEVAVLTAQNIGAGRGTAVNGTDIRTLKDARGETAGEEAARIGGLWSSLVETGIFSA